MTGGSKHIKWTYGIFFIELIAAYWIAFSLWSSSDNSFVVDFDYYRYKGFIYLLRDRYLDLVLILFSLASLAAWRGIKRAAAMMQHLKHGIYLVLDIIALSVILINIMGILNYLLHRDAFSTAGIDVILMVQLVYTIIGVAIGISVGVALLFFTIVWIKSVGTKAAQ